MLCLDRASADQVMREVHAGVCGLHMGGHMLAYKIMRIGCFWLIMETNSCQFVHKCPECQIHGDLIHAPPSELHALTSPWPFSIWGIDIIGKISPKYSNGHEFILVAIDYFTKWVEVASYVRLTSAKVASFIRSHIICRYGISHELILDRGVHFRAEVDTLLWKYGIRLHRSSAYKPQTNGTIETTNKNIKRIFKEHGWDFSRLVKETPFCTVGILYLFSHFYGSYTLLSSVWYGGYFASWDRDGFIESSPWAVDFWDRMGSGSIWSA